MHNVNMQTSESQTQQLPAVSSLHEKKKSQNIIFERKREGKGLTIARGWVLNTVARKSRKWMQQKAKKGWAFWICATSSFTANPIIRQLRIGPSQSCLVFGFAVKPLVAQIRKPHCFCLFLKIFWTMYTDIKQYCFKCCSVSNNAYSSPDPLSCS